MTLTPLEFQRYLQQMKLNDVGWEGQLKLKKAKVLCVGAGGLGSSLLLYLAAAGVGELIIVDDDVVELSNLQRQVLYQENHIGQSKVIVAKQQLTALNSDIQITIYRERLNARNAKIILNQADIMADCTDNFATRLLINDTAYALNKPTVFASVSEFQGHCALFLGKNSACFRCVFPTLPTCEDAPSCVEAGILGIVPGILGMIQAAEIIKWILNLGEELSEKILTVDLLNLKFQTLAISKDPNCRCQVSTSTL